MHLRGTMEGHYIKIESKIRSQYAQLAYERALQPDMQDKWRKACLNKTPDEIRQMHNSFWSEDREIKLIFEKMYKELKHLKHDSFTSSSRDQSP